MAQGPRDERVSRSAAWVYGLALVSLCVLAACRHDTINIYVEQAGSSGVAAASPPKPSGADRPSASSTGSSREQASAGASATGSSLPMAGAAAGQPPPETRATAAIGGAQAPALDESGWWMMGYDARNWYWNPTEHTLSVANAKQLKERWRANVMGTPNGTPVIARDKVFVTSSGGVYALDLETGKQVWMRADITGSSSLAFDADAVYVQNLTPALLYKLNANDGSTIWGPSAAYQADESAGESSPILAGGKVIVGHDNGIREASPDNATVASSRGGVEAFDMQTGAKAWTYYTTPESGPQAENGASVWSSVSVDVAHGRVFATTGNNYTIAGPNGDAFHAFDLATGERRWVTQVVQDDTYNVFSFKDIKKYDMDFGANPVLIERGGRHIVAAGNKTSTFYAVDADNGAILWARDKLSDSHTALYGGIFVGGAYDGEAFYVVANDSDTATAFVHKLEPDRGESVWMQKLSGVTWGAPSLANGLLLVPANTQLYVLNAQTGELLNQFETGGTIAGGAAAIASGRIVVKSGLVYAGDVKDNNQVICYGLADTHADTNTNTNTNAASPMAATFGAVYRDVIVASGCNSGVCHSSPSAGGLSLRTQALAYENLVNVPAAGMLAADGGMTCAQTGLVRVIPGAPERSLLLRKLDPDQPCGGPMPPNARVTAVQRQLVSDWIMRGARDD